MIQSFAPGEVTPEQAMQIGEELCDRYLKGDYQYVIAVHHDKSHLHCHIIFNNTNLYNGLSFTTEHNQCICRSKNRTCTGFEPHAAGLRTALLPDIDRTSNRLL